MSNQIQIGGGAKVRDLNGVITGTTGVLNSLPINSPNGIPQLDVNGKILVSQLPNSVMEFLGTWNAATNTPTLADGTGNAGDVYLCTVAGTVNFGSGPIVFNDGDYVVYSGSTWERSGGALGTVTSVAASITGNSVGITGSPITTAGTLAFAFAGTNLQYVNGAGNLTTFPTLITSIGLSMPTAFNVANSPLTANGTIAVTAAGFASQYIRGDGTLADFPSSGGGGSSVSYYLNGGTSQGVIGGTTYYEMSKTAVIGTGVDFAKSGDGLIVSFLTDANDPAQLNIPAGNWNYEIYASMSANGGTPEMYAELYKYDGTTFTLIATSPHEILYDGTALNLYTFAMAVPATTLTLTDRLAVKLYATNSGGKTTTIHTQDGHLCQIITTFSTGITALNGLTTQVQYFQTGTSGTDFNISSTTATHTFNLPTASATNRGALSSTDWSTFSAKQNALTLTTTGTSGAATLVGATLNIPNYAPDLSGYVPTSRTLTINGTTYDLSANRSWSIDSMVYPSAGIAVSTGTAWGTSLIDNSTNWNTAYSLRLTSATSPLSISANVISIAQATTSTSGYLSSTDFNTFSAKVNGSLTAGKVPFAVGSNSLGDTTLNYNGGNFGFGTAASTYRIDVSGDVNVTGNYYINGVAITTGGITGSGTTNYLPKFTGASTIGNSLVQDDGSTIGLGIAPIAGAKAYVYGTLAVRSGYGLQWGTNGYNLIYGDQTTNELYFYTNNVQRLLIASTGAATFSSSVTAGGALSVSYANARASINSTTATNSSYLSFGNTTTGYVGLDNSAGTDFGNGAYSLNLINGGAYNLNLGTSNTTRLTITSGGNILIGTTTDSGYKLDVNGTGRFSSSVTAVGALFTSATETRGNIRTTFASDNSYYSLFSNDGALTLDTYGAGGYMNFKILGSTKLTIASTGAATFSGSVSTGGDIKINNSGTTISNIAATSSQGGLNLYSGATADYNGGGLITLVSSDRSGAYTRGEIYISAGRATNNTANGFISLSTGDTERLRIASTGAATFSSPSSGLGSYQLTVTDGTKSIKFGANTTGAEIQSIGSIPLYINYSGNNTLLNTTSGNVGIGTSSPFSNARLQVKTATNINVAFQTGTTETTGIKINAFNDAADTNIPMELNGSVMVLKTGETERLRITSGGNLLVGTTTTATGLVQVNGTVYATGFYESSDIRFKNIIETNPNINLSAIDVIKFTRKDNDTNQVRYGYSAQQVQSILPDAVTGSEFLNVNYLDVHTLKIAQLEKEIKELKAKLN